MRADGGTSLYPDEDIPNFSLISSGVTEGGVGDFDQLTLRKMLKMPKRLSYKGVEGKQNA